MISEPVFSASIFELREQVKLAGARGLPVYNSWRLNKAEYSSVLTAIPGELVRPSHAALGATAKATMMNMREIRTRPVAESVLQPQRVVVEQDEQNTEAEQVERPEIAQNPGPEQLPQPVEQQVGSTQHRRPVVRVRTEAAFDYSTIQKLNLNDLD